MKVSNYKGGKLISLSGPLDSKNKILNLAYCIAFVVLTYGFIRMTIESRGFIEGQILCGVFDIGCLLASYRFANRVMMTENILVCDEKIRISKGGLFGRRRQVFEISSITHFRHLEMPEVARHPLAGESLDYLGAETERKMMLDDDNRLAFDYKGKTVSFGQNVYSWDFDAILNVLKEYGYR